MRRFFDGRLAVLGSSLLVATLAPSTGCVASPEAAFELRWAGNVYTGVPTCRPATSFDTTDPRYGDLFVRASDEDSAGNILSLYVQFSIDHTPAPGVYGTSGSGDQAATIQFRVSPDPTVAPIASEDTGSVTISNTANEGEIRLDVTSIAGLSGYVICVPEI